MAQARTHRDQGSLSGLVYSFFPAPASCQAPLPTVGLPSPCTVSNFPALLPASPPASWLPYPCTSGNLLALLETSLNISQTLFALSVPASLPTFLHHNLPRISCTSTLVSLSQLSLSQHPPSFLSSFSPYSSPFPSPHPPPPSSSCLLIAPQHPPLHPPPPFILQKLQHLDQAGGGEQCQERAP